MAARQIYNVLFFVFETAFYEKSDGKKQDTIFMAHCVPTVLSPRSATFHVAFATRVPHK